jgi:hypothetical protein
MSVCILLDSVIVRFDGGMVARRGKINMKRYQWYRAMFQPERV